MLSTHCTSLMWHIGCLAVQDLLTERQLSCMPFPAPTAQQGSSHGSSSSSSAQQAHTSTGSSNKSAGGAAEAAAGGSSSVVVKRQDGSCCSRVHVDEGCTIEQLLEALWEVEVSCAALESTRTGQMQPCESGVSCYESHGSCSMQGSLQLCVMPPVRPPCGSGFRPPC